MEIQTGMTVKVLNDGITTPHFPKGTIGKVDEKVSDNYGGYLYCVVKPFKRTDGSTIEVMEPFYAEDLEIVNL